MRIVDVGKRNSIEKTKYIHERYIEYLKSSFQFGNGNLQKLFENEIEHEDLLKGPYVDLILPFQRGKSLEELIEEGTVCKSFSKLKDINFKRPLYSHQEDAIKRIGAGRSAIITTGTGSGKTECFLYPILNELLSDLENGNHEVGVRAIFLYPMNALVNDQIDRVRKILSGFPDITYGFFTGETKETVPANYRYSYGTENDTYIPDNELVSREEIRKTPPHLLFTNYSMLEYLLIRPNDYSIFESKRLANWKYVVLDEAHSYYGSLGIELSLLMRRLTGLAAKKPRFILTSATLGQQGKSENEIVEFAKNLTSAEFNQEDIIFSKRIPLQRTSVEFCVTGNEYINLKKRITENKSISEICKKYMSGVTGNTKEDLYNLLLRDENVYRIYTILKNKSKNFASILAEYNGKLTEGELSSLIDLINQAEKKGIGLFDLKYHTFVRPLAGAYVTLGSSPKLKLTKTNNIGEYKAFEIGNCKYCYSPYIIGKIQHNDVDGLDYLFQNNEIDIYENYGNNEYIKLDYFLLKNAVSEEMDSSIIDEHRVCSKCGAIHVLANLNAKKCNCGDEYQVPIYRVKQEKGKDAEPEAFNNLNYCPCCGHRTTSEIVKSLNLGKDEGTALIAQMLYEAIDEGSVEVKQKAKLSLKLKKNQKNDIDYVKAKQFLAFSDSRQQASFAAVFFDSNHVRFLRKRLIWKVIEEHNYQDITVDELASYLTTIIKGQSLFQNDLSAYKNAWIAILVDLLRVDGRYDGEGLGLYYFDLDISDIMEMLDEADIEEAFGKYNINKHELESLIKVVFNVFKITPAIDYTKSTLTPNEKREYLEFRRFDNHVRFSSPKAESSIRSFMPIKSKENATTRYVKKVCGCNDEEAAEILEIVFNLFVETIENPEIERILVKHNSKDAYQIDASRYVLKNYKSSKYYRCTKCGGLTPYNVHNKCVQDKCDGTLVEVDPDKYLASNYYRNQYKNKKIERIVIKEHTAQLDRKTAKKYQLDFKNKKINILSCSTTFEMGIDIGDLETVYMRNVPPTPANYVQRAGRAGRRKDSAAYILTYCGTGSHDYTYFTEPEKMISGVIKPPYFNVLNKKIIIRHLMATCLGSFFRKYPAYFKSIDGLVFDNGVELFKDYIKSHPNELKGYIDHRIIPGSEYSEYHNFKWFDDIDGNDEKMIHFVESVQELAKEYEGAKQAALKDESYKEADYFSNQIEKLHRERVLDALSKYCVIPKYGFPVDVVELQVYDEGIRNNKYDLDRDLRIAISEYAPDSEVIVDGKKYTSQYVTLPKSSQYPRHYFCTCSNCGKINVFASKRVNNKCKYCGQDIESESASYFIEPIDGFKTGITKESTRMKPKRTYSGEVSYLGGGIKDEKILQIGSLITVESSTNDELLVMNKSDFYMCPICGFSSTARKGIKPPQLEMNHKNYRQYDCQNNELEKLRLGHRFQTDVARFIIPTLESKTKVSYSIALSFLYAFLEGVSNALEIERNDIDGILEMNYEERSYDILLYDNVPGGAGHVKRLINRDAVMESLKSALAKVSQSCCDSKTSCYNCLRNYYNQSYHSRLQRGYAKDFIEELVREIEFKS